MVKDEPSDTRARSANSAGNVAPRADAVWDDRTMAALAGRAAHGQASDARRNAASGGGPLHVGRAALGVCLPRAGLQRSANLPNSDTRA